MLIRAAIALEDDVQAQALQRALIAASLRSFDSEAPGAARSADYEIDIAICHNDWDALRGMAGDLDLIFLSYTVLAQHRAALRQLVHGNPLGFRIAVGEPEADICRYLAVQPAGHMRSALDESAVGIGAIPPCVAAAHKGRLLRHFLCLYTIWYERPKARPDPLCGRPHLPAYRQTGSIAGSSSAFLCPCTPELSGQPKPCDRHRKIQLGAFAG